MRLILIRHGDPDYEHDNLTEKGKKEAALLAKRAKHWKVDDVYVSPLGRAVATAEPCLKEWGKKATTLDWAQEFWYGGVDDGKGGVRLVWDYLPYEWTNDDKNFNENEWTNIPFMSNAKAPYATVCKGLDELMASYGYRREDRAYKIERSSEKTVVIFCHFGVSMMFLSHLLNLPARALLHSFFLAPTSVTVLNMEERNGADAYFRVERLGDCSHLIVGNEPISPSGYFASLMQEDLWNKE